MEAIRKPFQGVSNIVRFNWHFYLVSLVLLSGMFLFSCYVTSPVQYYLYMLGAAITGTSFISLLVSFYVYDLSGLYRFDWLTIKEEDLRIVNISAGFDETSAFLSLKYAGRQLTVLDFYDPVKHTEVSIKRAREAYSLFPGTLQINTTSIPMADGSADKILVILSAHEIRNFQERINFFRELNRIIQSHGEIIVMEHLRDTANFLAYNIGFFHFYSRSSWLRVFNEAHLVVQDESKITPFLSTFTLTKHGSTF